MKRILRLYPSAWRERYGEEMDSILDERPMGPFELIDLALGAIDAHLHLRGLGHRSEHRKGITMSLRTAGNAAIIGGLAWATTWAIIALDQLVGPGEGNVPVVFITVAVGGVATLVALAGLSAVQARVHRRATWLSFLAPAAGIVLMLVGFLGMSAIEVFWAIGMIGLFAYTMGTILFAVVTYVTRVFSRSAALALGLGAIVQVVAFLSGLASGGTDAFQVFMLVGTFLFALGWLGLGIDAVRRDRLTLGGDAAAA